MDSAHTVDSTSYYHDIIIITTRLGTVVSYHGMPLYRQSLTPRLVGPLLALALEQVVLRDQVDGVGIGRLQHHIIGVGAHQPLVEVGPQHLQSFARVPVSHFDPLGRVCQWGRVGTS